jgi:phosphoribosylaminoimidazole carboxylase (NCAIR synthetase)
MAGTTRPVVLLATCSAMPAGEEWAGTNFLVPALEARGLDARWVVWDDAGVDWSEGLVAVRSTWDYEQRLEEFLDWARTLPWMLNSPHVFAWNTDKAYLVELAAAGVDVVPTTAVDTVEDIAPAVTATGPAVVKPRTGAGGRGVVVVRDELPSDFGRGPWVVQPMVESVHTEGETSVFVLDGEVVSQARKVPAEGEFRVHELYGGTTIPVAVTDEAADLARRALLATERILGERLDYARVDQMRLADGRLAVSELEVTEPGLYLEVLPGNAEAFADLVAARLRP